MPPAAINLAETFNLPVCRQLPQYISHLSLARQWFKNVAAGESKVGYAGLSEGLKIWGGRACSNLLVIMCPLS